MPADVGKLPRELGGGAVLPAMDDRSCVLLLRGERLLMVRQTYRGRLLWTLPGGAPEPGETPAAAADRGARPDQAEIRDARFFRLDDLPADTSPATRRLAEYLNGHRPAEEW